MALNDDRQAEKTEEVVRIEAPPILVCAGCGGGFSMWQWQPRLSCPHCRMLGYPDRAIHNLLPLGWDCPNCGAGNPVMANFCLSCGTGLTSRCLRCETPIYTAVCPHCGAHQAAMLRYQIAQTRRVIWEPIVRARIQEQQEQEQAAQAIPIQTPPPEPEVTPSRPPQRARSRPRQGPSGSQTIVGIGLIAFGFYMLERQGLVSFSQLFQDFSAGVTLPTWVVSIWNWARTIPGQLETLSTEDPRYFVMFATVVFGLAVSFLIYRLFDSITRRIFP